MTVTMMTAQRHTDRLDRGLVVSKAYNSNYLSWRRLTTEYYDVKYNVYRNGSRIATNYNKTNYTDNNSSEDNQYTVKAVVNGVEKNDSLVQKMWKGYKYEGSGKYSSFLDIPLAAVYDRDSNDVTSHYEPNDAEMADLDGDGQLEIIVKRLNTVDAAGYDSGLDNANGNDRYIIYPKESREFVVLDAYDVNWQTGKSKLLWRIDCGPNMVSSNSTEINIIAYDWDEDGRAEVVLRGVDNMIVYGSDGQTRLYTVGDMSVNTRNTWYSTDAKGSDTGSMAYTSSGAEYLLYLNGQTGELYQQMNYPLTRESASAWGDSYGHRSSKYFFGAPFLDGRHASLFLGRGIYTRHKMMAMDLDRKAHKWKELWSWNCNDSSSPWYGNGYHNYLIADVDEDGRDEIVYGSMVIDDNGKGLSTTGYGHGDAQHVGDFDPYRKGLEFMGCLEENPYWGSNYRNATTSEVYFKHTNPKGEGKSGDDGRCLIGNFSDKYPGCVGRSIGSGVFSSVADKTIPDPDYVGDNYIAWGDLNFRIYWDGDLRSEILNSPGKAREAKVEKPGTGRLFTSSGCNMNNDSKNNPCFQGDIIGDWREEIVVRCGGNLRVYTTGLWTEWSLPTLWNDHQYRQAMVWQMMAYNQPPHLSYFLGEMEEITVAPPTLTDEGRTEIANGGTVGRTGDGEHLLICETGNMTVSVEDGAAPGILTVNTPTWVQGTDVNGTSGTKVRGDGSVGATNLPEIRTTTYTHTLTGGAFAGTMRLVKQGDGVLVLPDVTETYTGETNVWAGTLRFNGTMASSPVWLNRFATLDTDGGTFGGGVTADYGATIAVGNGGMTTTTLTLNHGARLKVSIGSDGKATPVNISNLILKKKSGEVWEQYGPKYLKPVIEFTHSGSLNDGTYFIGDVGEVSGSLTNDIILEGLDGVNTPRLLAEGGKLFLIVGTGESATCPPATFAVSGYQRTENGLLPIVSINPGTFSYGGTEVVPNGVTAAFNDTGVELGRYVLYSEDFNQATEITGWTHLGAPISIETGDTDHGNYFFINLGETNTRYAYTRLSDVDVSQFNRYAIEFDLAINPGNTDPMEFCVMSKGGKNPSKAWDNYAAINDYKNMLFDITAPKNSNTYTVNGTNTTTDLASNTWYHITLDVNRSAGTVAWAISNGSKGILTLPEGTSSEVDGFYLVMGRYYSKLRFDDIRIYRTDSYYFAFTEPGTLTVTTGYTGCESGTATYTATEYVKMGDANMDGRVDISDVTAAISYIAGQTPEKFCKEAADMDGNGTVEAADLRAMVNQIVGSNQ